MGFAWCVWDFAYVIRDGRTVTAVTRDCNNNTPRNRLVILIVVIYKYLQLHSFAIMQLGALRPNPRSSQQVSSNVSLPQIHWGCQIVVLLRRTKNVDNEKA